MPIHENFYFSITRLDPWIATFGTAPVLTVARAFRNGSRPSPLAFQKLKDHRQLLSSAFDLGAPTCQGRPGRNSIALDLPIHENFYFSITRVDPWIAAFGTAPVLQPSFLKS